MFNIPAANAQLLLLLLTQGHQSLIKSWKTVVLLSIREMQGVLCLQQHPPICTSIWGRAAMGSPLPGTGHTCWRTGVCINGKDYFRRRQKRHLGNNCERMLLKLQAGIPEQGILLQNWEPQEAVTASRAPCTTGYCNGQQSLDPTGSRSLLSMCRSLTSQLPQV